MRTLLTLSALSLSGLFGQTIDYHGSQVPYEIRGDSVIIYGDIVAGTTAELLGSVNGSSKTSQRPLPQAGADVTSLWPKVGAIAQIPYVDRSNLPAVKTAIDTFNRQFANVAQWVPRNQETEYVIIESQTRQCDSYLGRRSGGPQTLNVITGCVFHEMGHAMGLTHAEQQPDRDNFIAMSDADLDLGNRGEFDISPFRYSRTVGGYSYNTAVSYDPGRLSRTGRLTYESIPPGIVIQSAGGDRFSVSDVDTISRLVGAAPTQVTVTTHPEGLRMIVDGATVTSPQTYAWQMGTTHIVEIPAEAQALGDSMHVFGNWSDLGARRHIVSITPGSGGTVDPVASPATTLYTANFVRYSPINVNPVNGIGRTSFAPEGVTFPGSATPFYRERQVYTVTSTPGPNELFYAYFGGGFFLLPVFDAPVATAVPLGPVLLRPAFVTAPVTTIATNPPGMDVQVNGRNGMGPVNFTERQDRGWGPGTTQQVSVATGPQTQAGVSTSWRRWIFDNWSDGGAAAHAITASADLQERKVITANFRAEYKLATAFACAGTAALTPAPADGFYAAASQVTVTATPGAGFFLTGWAGWPALTPVASQTLAVDMDHLIEARWNTIADPLTITSVTPATLTSNGAVVTITVNGTGFTDTAWLQISSDLRRDNRVARFVSATQLQFDLTPQDLAGITLFRVQAQNPQGNCRAFSPWLDVAVVRDAAAVRAPDPLPLPAGGWQLVDNVPMNQMSAAADGTIMSSNAVSELHQRADNGWVRLPGESPLISVVNARQAFASTTAAGLYLFNGIGWAQIPMPAGLLRFTWASAASDGTLLGVAADGAVHRRDAASGAWSVAAPAGSASRVAIRNAREYYMVRPDGSIQKIVGADATAMPGRAADIAVSSTGDVWAVQANGEIDHWTGFAWDRAPGLLKQIVIGNPTTIWGINGAGAVYRWQ